MSARPARFSYTVTPYSELSFAEDITDAVKNFLALYDLEVACAYTDGRLKVRTANGAYCDLPRFKNFKTHTWEFTPGEWLQEIHRADKLYRRMQS